MQQAFCGRSIAALLRVAQVRPVPARPGPARPLKALAQTPHARTSTQRTPQLAQARAASSLEEQEGRAHS